jgi:hypothetical protein
VKFGTNVDLENSVPARRFKFLIYEAGTCNAILKENNLLRDLPSLRVLASRNMKKWFWERRELVSYVFVYTCRRGNG